MIYLVAGTRPNFMKIAPVYRALSARGVPLRLLHTGQHFDAAMSDVFFRDLGLGAPDKALRAGGGSHAEQTAAVLVGAEADLVEHRPRLVVVVGHSRCGAVGAALEGAKPGGSVDSVIEALEETVSAVRAKAGDVHEAASRRNVLSTVERLRTQESGIRNLVEDEGLEIIGAYYDLDTGRIEMPIEKGDSL